MENKESLTLEEALTKETRDLVLSFINLNIETLIEDIINDYNIHKLTKEHKSIVITSDKLLLYCIDLELKSHKTIKNYIKPLRVITLSKVEDSTYIVDDIIDIDEDFIEKEKPVKPDITKNESYGIVKSYKINLDIQADIALVIDIIREPITNFNYLDITIVMFKKYLDKLYNIKDNNG
jgi:hypothetical protein